MRILQLLLPISTILILSSTVAGQDTNYTGDKYQDSVVNAVEARFKNSAVKTSRNKMHFGTDSLVYYAVDKQTNQLVAVGFTEISTDRRTMYDLINGELIRVRYISNHRKSSSSAIYYFDNGNVLFKRERNANAPKGEKFIEDILFFKKALGVQ
jgi:hypothetical protein